MYIWNLKQNKTKQLSKHKTETESRNLCKTLEHRSHKHINCEAMGMAVIHHFINCCLRDTLCSAVDLNSEAPASRKSLYKQKSKIHILSDCDVEKISQ